MNAVSTGTERSSFAILRGRFCPAEHHREEYLVGGVDLTQQTELRLGDTDTILDNPSVAVVGVYYSGDHGSRVTCALAARTVNESLLAQPHHQHDIAQALSDALVSANNALCHLSASDVRYRGCWTTATLAGVCDTTLVVAHVGGARAILLREKRSCVLTREQTLRRYAREAGLDHWERIPEHCVTQALGMSPRVLPAMTALSLRRGDRLVIHAGGAERDATPRASSARLETFPGSGDALASLLAGTDGTRVGGAAVILDFIWHGLSLPQVDDPAPRLVEVTLLPFRDDHAVE